MPRLENGIWIAFEGSDGAGKSEMLSRTAVYLESLGYSVVKTREPGGNPLSELIREQIIFNSELACDGKSQLLAFVLARRLNILQVVLPALLARKIVLSDRSEGSTFAYQQYQMRVDREAVSYINGFATDENRPDLTLFLDVPLEVGMERVRRAKPDQMTYFDKAAREAWMMRSYGYRRLVQEFSDWARVDADRGKDEVFADIINIIQERGIIRI